MNRTQIEKVIADIEAANHSSEGPLMSRSIRTDTAILWATLEMNPGVHLSIFDKLRLWWHGYCPKHLCEKVMTEPSIGRLCPECELERMKARQDAIARIDAGGEQ